MPGGLDSQRLGAVFGVRPDILAGIQKAADSPARVTLFNDIATFVHQQIHGPEPASKRRRVDEGPSGGFKATNTNGSASGASKGAAPVSSAADDPVRLEIKEISVSVPQRKKFDLCFTDNYLYARAPGTTEPVSTITYAWTDIEYAFYLPVPEKTQVQHNYVLFPRGTALPSKTNPPSIEPLVFTVPSTAPKAGTIAGPNAGAAATVSDAYKTLFDWALSTHLSGAGNPVPIVAADPSRFHSNVRQPHRPNEKAVHVKAFRGSKDGYLFFLATGILWGFKKPLLFVPQERIAAVSYTNVLQRTFNVVVEAFTGEGDATEELEFAMLDQEDYEGIDENYVKRNRLQDRSMAEQRRAKMQLAENLKGGKKGEDEGDGAAVNGAVGADGLTELERAQAEAEQQQQQQQEDEDEEDEEDYDPGSEGDSEGEGETSDEDDEDEEMGEGDDDDDDEDGEEEDEKLDVAGRG